MEFENYPLPPIQEAILDIYVTLPEEIDVEVLKQFGEKVASNFPDQKPRYQFSSTFKVNLEDKTKSSSGSESTHLGWICRTSRKEKAVQARVNGFTFNRLPVYEGWRSFVNEAKELWAEYKEIAKPVFITNIAVRNINRILVPLPFKDFRDYCILFPNFPTGIPSELNDFVMRFSGESRDIPNATTAISLTFEPPPPNKAVLPLLLDVHVAKPFQQFPVGDDKEIWSTFELMRQEKNRIFESSITDAARALFRK